MGGATFLQTPNFVLATPLGLILIRTTNETYIIFTGVATTSVILDELWDAIQGLAPDISGGEVTQVGEDQAEVRGAGGAGL